MQGLEPWSATMAYLLTGRRGPMFHVYFGFTRSIRTNLSPADRTYTDCERRNLSPRRSPSALRGHSAAGAARLWVNDIHGQFRPNQLPRGRNTASWTFS